MLRVMPFGIVFMILVYGSLSFSVFRSVTDSFGGATRFSNYGFPFTFASYVGTEQIEFSTAPLFLNLLVAVAVAWLFNQLILRVFRRFSNNGPMIATNDLDQNARL